MKAIRLLMLTFVIASPFALYSMEEVENKTVCDDNFLYKGKKKDIYNEFLQLEKHHQDDKELYSHVGELFKQRNFDLNDNSKSLPFLCREVLTYIDIDKDYSKSNFRTIE